MHFDIVAKFETKVMVKLLDRDFEDLLNACSYGNVRLPHSIHTLEHTINITNSPVIPNDEWIEQTKNILFNGVAESLAENIQINASPIETVFVGFTKIVQHEET